MPRSGTQSPCLGRGRSWLQVPPADTKLCCVYLKIACAIRNVCKGADDSSTRGVNLQLLIGDGIYTVGLPVVTPPTDQSRVDAIDNCQLQVVHRVRSQRYLMLCCCCC